MGGFTNNEMKCILVFFFAFLIMPSIDIINCLNVNVEANNFSIKLYYFIFFYLSRFRHQTRLKKYEILDIYFYCVN